MHDWTLTAIHFDWTAGCVTIELKNQSSKKVAVVADGVSTLVVPRLQEWGPSSSVNELRGPSDITGGKHLFIEMQSGDVIEISARTFILPAEA